MITVWKFGSLDWDLGRDFCRKGADYSFLSVYLVAFFSPAKMLAWFRAKSQFHSLDLAAIFLRVVVVAGVWVSLFLSKSHATLLVCAESEFEKSVLLISESVHAHLYSNLRADLHLVWTDIPAWHKALTPFHISSPTSPTCPTWWGELMRLPAGSHRILTQTPATVISAHHHQACIQNWQGPN